MVSIMISRELSSKQVQQAGTKERDVSFGDVSVQVHAVGLVVNPGVSSELPIGLMDSYTLSESVPVTEYEASKTLAEGVPTWGDAATATSRGPMRATHDPQLRHTEGRYKFLMAQGYTRPQMEEVYSIVCQAKMDRAESKADEEARDWAEDSIAEANQSTGALEEHPGAPWANSMWREKYLCPGAPQKEMPESTERIIKAASFDGTSARRMLFQPTCPGAPKKEKPESTECIHEAAAFGGTAQLLFLALPSPDNHVSITITSTPMPAEVPAKAGRRGVVKRIIASGIYTTTLAAIVPTAVMLLAVFS